MAPSDCMEHNRPTRPPPAPCTAPRPNSSSALPGWRRSIRPRVQFAARCGLRRVQPHFPARTRERPTPRRGAVEAGARLDANGQVGCGGADYTGTSQPERLLRSEGHRWNTVHLAHPTRRSRIAPERASGVKREDPRNFTPTPGTEALDGSMAADGGSVSSRTSEASVGTCSHCTDASHASVKAGPDRASPCGMTLWLRPAG
jgi:hypothetical protein